MALILVVDDSLYARRVHGRILESAGHEVVMSGSGAEALEAYAMRRPELVLLDLTMADMGGIEVLGKLRELDPDTTVIVVSADVQRSTEEAVMAAGAHAFLGKPVASGALLDAVGGALRP
jgi:two-component system, chemotaxis family, chemotaxis protein CheY